jgi:dATP pyrophosphohydrolase
MQKHYRLPIQVLVYCYRRKADGSEYLMLRRTPKYGAFWQGVTGAPEVGETLLEGAARELKEETQLAPKSLDQVDFGYSFPVEDDWKWAYDPNVTKIDEFVFLAEVADDVEPILSFEHDSFEWAKVERAVGLLKWLNNRNALLYCHQLLLQTCGR